MSLIIDLNINNWISNYDLSVSSPDIDYLNKLLNLGFQVSQLSHISINPSSNILEPLNNKIDRIDINYSNTCDKMETHLEAYTSNIKLLETNLGILDTKINSNINRSYDETNQQYMQLLNVIQKLTGDCKTSSIKGKIGENYIQNVLINSFPDDTIEVKALVGHEADIHLLSKNYPKILIESKLYKTNINKKEIQKFYNDLDTTGINYGIFISLSSSITGHKRLEYKHINGKHVIFIPNAGFDSYNIIYGILFLREIFENVKDYNTLTPEIIEEKCDLIYNSLENLDLIFEQISKLKMETFKTKTIIDTQINSLITNMIEMEIFTKNIVTKMKHNISQSLSQLNNDCKILENDEFDEIISNLTSSEIILNRLLGNSLLLFKDRKYDISKDSEKPIYYLYKDNNKIVELKIGKTKSCYDFLNLGIKYDIKKNTDIVKFSNILESIL